MQEDNLDETKPTKLDQEETPLDQTQPSESINEAEEKNSQPKKPPTLLKRILVGILIFTVIVAIGSAIGYSKAINDRVNVASTTQVAWKTEQFQRALEEIEEKEFYLARQRLETIIKVDPSYPGAADLLIIVLQAERSTATPTTVPTNTLTPTPDIRGEIELFNNALVARQAEDWDTLISILDSLRSNNKEYKPVEVDGLYYVALRNRASVRILQLGDLEGGIYDLTRAEQFAPLDVQGQGLKQWAIWYITGASFWEVNWAQATEYFSLVAQVAPNLSDTSYFTASQRLATAQVHYGAQLLDLALDQTRKRDWCKADANFKQAYQWVTPITDPDMSATAVQVFAECLVVKENE